MMGAPTATGFGNAVWDANCRSAPGCTVVVTEAELFAELASCKLEAIETVSVTLPPKPFVGLTTREMLARVPTATDPDCVQVTVPDEFAHVHPVPLAET